jgi:NADH dehydrogenase
VLVEGAERLLPGLDARLARYSEDQLRRRGVEVRLGTRLVSCEDGVVQLSDERTAPYRSPTIVWTAWQRPHPLPRLAGLPVDDQGRVCVDDHLRVQGFEGIFALGDAAAAPTPVVGRAQRPGSTRFAKPGHAQPTWSPSWAAGRRRASPAARSGLR